MAYRVIKWMMAVLAVAYLPAVFLIPGLAGLKGSALGWLVYGAYVLFTVMVWAIGHKAGKPLGEDIDRDQVNKETVITQQVEASKHFWTQM